MFALGLSFNARKHLVEKIQFAGNIVAIVREADVKGHLSLEDAVEDLRLALTELGLKQAVNCPRTRVEWPHRGNAWLHTLRAGLSKWGVAGGKDYTSLGFETPAMWATVVDLKSGLPVAFVEADYLSRLRTAATTAIATDLLAPRDPGSLGHFGVGKISEFLVKAVLKVRPSIRRVLFVRRDLTKKVPEWIVELESRLECKLTSADQALNEADLITTATSSDKPVIPSHAAVPRVRHLNLIGSNHLKRREISDDVALRCLPPAGYLVVDDQRQATLEAGDFTALEQSGQLTWDHVPTLAQLIVDPKEQQKAAKATLTAFKSVGIGLTDLALATGVLRRMGVLSDLLTEKG